jgi:MFS family permease
MNGAYKEVRSGALINRDGTYAWFVALLLMLAFTVSFIDRQVLNLLIDPIKHDLGASDTQMSLLQGAGFTVAYLAFGPVFGRLADMYRRRNVLILGVAMWSTFSILCGFATNIPTLFIARAGVGAAEAALGPACVSILADYFTKKHLARAVSIYLFGPYLGGGLALILGGLIMGSAATLSHLTPAAAELKPWQLTFILVGAPGFLLALILFAIREPTRVAIAEDGVTDERHFTLREALSFLWERRGFYWRFTVMMTLIVVNLYALPAWMPSLLIRVYGASPKHVGFQFGTVVLVAGSIGVLAGPYLVNLLRKYSSDGSNVILCVVIAAFLLSFSVALIGLAPTYTTALALSALATLFYSMPLAVATSALLLTTPNRMRSIVASLYTVCVSGFGLGVAPTLVALITDSVFHNPARVGYSLSIVCAVSAALAGLMGINTLPHFRSLIEAEDKLARAGSAARLAASA